MRSGRERCRPRLESLEDRTLPTVTRIVVDFSPDPMLRNEFIGSVRRPFTDTFNLRDPAGHVLPFLDFNGDGKTDATDAKLAASAILAKVASYFTPFADEHVTVVGKDILHQNHAGLNELRRGLASKRLQTFEMYVGGFSTVDSGIFGESFQAPAGRNNESYGRAYSDSIAGMFVGQQPPATPADFVDFVGSTVAHETGHMLGLGHPDPDNTDKTNVMDSSADGKADSFFDHAYPADVFLRANDINTVVQAQNAVQELRASFGGQPSLPPDPRLFQPPRPPQPPVVRQAKHPAAADGLG
jgi:hypothetical protein